MGRRLELHSWEEDGNRHVGLRRTEPRAHHLVIAEAAARYCGPHASILDFGCGAGQLSQQLARLLPSARLTAADAYEVCLSTTRKVVPSAETVRVAEDRIDVEPFDSTFDLVVLSHVLEHTANPVESLETILGLVTPGGHCIVAVPNPARPKVLWYGVRRFNSREPWPRCRMGPCALAELHRHHRRRESGRVPRRRGAVVSHVDGEPDERIAVSAAPIGARFFLGGRSPTSSFSRQRNERT